MPKRCLNCGYIVDGLSDNRCPECGRAFDPDNPKTYWRTRRSGIKQLVSSLLGCYLLAMAMGAVVMSWFAVRWTMAGVLVTVLLIIATTAWSGAALAQGQSKPVIGVSIGWGVLAARVIDTLVLLGALGLWALYSAVILTRPVLF